MDHTHHTRHMDHTRYTHRTHHTRHTYTCTDHAHHTHLARHVWQVRELRKDGVFLAAARREDEAKRSAYLEERGKRAMSIMQARALWVVSVHMCMCMSMSCVSYRHPHGYSLMCIHSMFRLATS